MLAAGNYWTKMYPYTGIPLIEWTATPTTDSLAAAWAPYQRRLDALPDPPKTAQDRATILKEVGAILREVSTSDEKLRVCLTKRLLDWYVTRTPAISKQIVDEMTVELAKLAKTPTDPYGTRFYTLAEEWIALDRIAGLFGSGCGLVRAELQRIVGPAEAAELAIAKAGECPVALHIDRYVRMLTSTPSSDELYAICQEQDPGGWRPKPLGDWVPGPVSALVANAALAYAQTGWVMSGDTTSVDAVTEAIVDAGWILVEGAD